MSPLAPGTLEPLEGRYVPGVGRTPNDWMIVGEAPGETEAHYLEPFVGKSGQEQDTYLAQHDLYPRHAYKTNVMKQYREGNPDPTPDDVAMWSPVLEVELADVQPRVIFAVGRFAMRWFLGDAAELETCHGMPYKAGAFDPSRAHRGGPYDAIIVPCYHPAMGLYSPDARGLIAYDYGRAAAVLKKVRRNQHVDIVQDKYPGVRPGTGYYDVTGFDLAALLTYDMPAVIALDTEGSTTDASSSDLWSVQVSWVEGTGYTLRCDQPDFAEGISYLSRMFNVHGATCVLHNAMYDMQMCRRMGLELSRARLWDTMYAAFLLRTEPQGLKPLARRWCGMAMQDYLEIVRPASDLLRYSYLSSVAALDEETIPKPLPQIIYKNDGTTKQYKPTWVVSRMKRVLKDYDADPTVDLGKRWEAVDDDQRQLVEEMFGPLPIGTLGNVPLDVAVEYASRDADATLRMYNVLAAELAKLDLERTMADGMAVLPVIEEIQSSGGMYASRSKFSALLAEVQDDMARMQSRLSWEFYTDHMGTPQPFNPNSRQQVASLLERRGLEPAKLTDTGEVSTGKKSIEHLKYVDPAVELIIEWRESQKIRDAFLKPALRRAKQFPTEHDLFPMRCEIKMTRVASRRLSAANPNLLQIPARHELGIAVRNCYVAPPGYLYGSWDLSAIEMRVMAHESGDPFMCALFSEFRCQHCGEIYKVLPEPAICARCDGEVKPRDIHAETASRIFNIPLKEVDKIKHRMPAKTVGFLVLYGGSGSAMYEQLLMKNRDAGKEWSIEKCEAAIAAWFDTFPRVRDYVNRTADEIYRTGYARDHWGMYRFLPGAWSRDPGIRAAAAREAVSLKIQGGAQGLIQNSMVWLKERVWELQSAGHKVQWALQVHDEVILLFEESLAPVMDALAREALINQGRWALNVPIEASGSTATSWGKLK